MTKLQFEQVMDEAARLLCKNWDSIGVCHALQFAEENVKKFRCVNYFTKNKFNELFSPEGAVGIDNRRGYWLGDRARYNLKMRLDFLAMFREICLAEKYYLDF